MRQFRSTCRSISSPISLAICLGLNCIVASTAPAAAKAQEMPAAMTFKLQPLNTIGETVIPPLDMVQVQKQDEDDFQNGLAPRYAVPTLVNISPKTDGTWERLDANTQVWRLRIHSPGALSINLGFSRYVMPPGGRLFVYSQDGAEIIRPFTSADTESHGELWTPPLNRDAIVVELTIPDALVDQYELTLGSINIGYRRFGPQDFGGDNGEGGIASGSCNIDVVCPEGDPWRDQIPAIAVISTGGSKFCTGFMVNNVRQDRKPYFMTANHCGINTGNAASLVVFWNYENSTCRPIGSGASGGAGDGSLSTFQTGSFFRSALASSDFTLVELDDTPDPAWELSWAGWDRDPGEAISGSGIHHPNTDEKRISIFSAPTVTVTSWTVTTPNPNGDHLHVFWAPNGGVTEPGSSGSPLFNQNKRIIGQLHGGPSSCTANDKSDFYGRFSKSWDTGATPATRLKDWLDPDNTNAMFTDTLVGSGLGVSPGANVTHVGVVGGPFTNNPTVYTISNTTPAPANYSISIVPGGTAPILINGGTGPISGTLAGGGGSVNIAVSLDASANALPAGIVSSTVQFVDTTNNVTTTRIHSVEVGQVGFTTTPANGLASGGPVGGPFTGTQAYLVTSTKPTPVTVRVAASAPWISINGGAGPVALPLAGTGASSSVTIGYSPAANSLAAGLYNGSVTFTNIGSGGAASDTARPIQLDVGRYSYASLEVPQPINDNSTITSTVTVTDSYCIGDVDLDLNITHTYIGDLIVEIKSPQGTVVRLHNRTGGSADNIIKLYDDAVTPPDGPGLLANFNGQSVNGLWTLTVSDNANADTGTLNAWTLKIASSGAVCPPVANNVTVSVAALVTSPITLQGVSSSGRSLNSIITSLPAHGTLSDPNGGIIAAAPYTLLAHGAVVNYMPTGPYTGPDSFTYKVNDGQDSNSANVNITVGGVQLIHNFPLDSNPGWSTTGQWAWGHPTGGGSHGLDPANGFTGTNVYGYNLAGDYPNNLTPIQYLTTTAINCSNLTNVELRFKRWLGVEQTAYDHASIDISTNGTTWTNIWNHTSSTAISETAWSSQAYPLGAAADHAATLYVRWGMGTTDGSITYPGWNIDDIQIWGIKPPCAPDVTGNGIVNIDDLLAVINTWGPCPGCPADVNGNGIVNIDDLLAVINGWGTCP